MAAELVGGEGGEILSVALEFAGAGAGRQTARANRPALAAPIETPHRDPARRQIAHRLELLFDEFAKAADHHAFGARLLGRQVAPAQPHPVRGGKAAPGEARRLEEASRQGWRLGDADVSRRRQSIAFLSH